MSNARKQRIQRHVLRFSIAIYDWQRIYIYIYIRIFFERVQGRENLINVAANIDRIIVEFPFIPLPLSSLSNHLSIHLETSRATAERYTQQWRTEMRKRGNPLSLLV